MRIEDLLCPDLCPDADFSEITQVIDF